jgi:hypothetical protein
MNFYRSLCVPSLCEGCSAAPPTLLLESKNRSVAEPADCGDNLSVRFYFQNSISLTIAASPRIIPP